MLHLNPKPYIPLCHNAQHGRQFPSKPPGPFYTGKLPQGVRLGHLSGFRDPEGVPRKLEWIVRSPGPWGNAITARASIPALDGYRSCTYPTAETGHAVSTSLQGARCLQRLTGPPKKNSPPPEQTAGRGRGRTGELVLAKAEVRRIGHLTARQLLGRHVQRMCWHSPTEEK